MNRLVQLSVNTPSPSSDLKVRIYYPVKLLTGPDLQICRTYDEYLSYYGEDSFAQLLFSWNYELLCHRVSYINSVANLTKYEIDGEYKYYQDTDRYIINANIIKPNPRNNTHKNSLLVTINQDIENYNDFYIIMRSKVTEGSNIYTYSIGLFGCDYIKNQDPNHSFEEGKEYIKSHFDLEPLSRTMFLPDYEITPQGYIDRRLDLNSFDLVLGDYFTNCGFMVEPLGYHRYLVSSVSEDISYSILSNIISVEELEDYYDRYYASTYKDHRILSISSKYKTGQDSIDVKIEKLDTESYSVHVSKISGDWIGEEYFVINPYVIGSDNVFNSFDDISHYSKYINIDVFKDYDYYNLDITGDYKLKNSFGFNDNILFINKLSVLTEDVIKGYYYNQKFYIDLNYTEMIDPEIGITYEDLLTSEYYVWDGLRYDLIDYIESDTTQSDIALLSEYDSTVITKLNQIFPQALIMTPPGDKFNNGLRINPSTVYWFNYNYEIPSGLAVLGNVMTTSYYNDVTQFRLPETYPIVTSDKYDLNIVESDYGMEIKSVYVNRLNGDMNYTMRAFISRAMIYRICTDISGITFSEIHNYIERMCSQVSSITNLNVTYELRNESKVGRTYKADLIILVDNRLFTRFEIYAELNYEG